MTRRISPTTKSASCCWSASSRMETGRRHRCRCAAFGRSGAVLPDHVVRHRHDARRRAVIHFQLDPLGIGKVLLKVENVADVGLPPAIDRLVRIADHEEILVPIASASTSTYCTRLVS